MAEKNQLGYSRIGKNLTGIEQLNVGPNGLQVGATFNSITVTDSFAVPVVPPSAATRVTGSMYYDTATNRLLIYESAGNQWFVFQSAGAIP